MFFRVLAAMITADVIDRRRRRQHELAWLAAQNRLRHSHAATPGQARQAIAGATRPDAPPAGLK